MRLVSWVQRNLRSPTTLYYLANNSSKWHPRIFTGLVEGTRVKIIRHNISQKQMLYRKVDPGYQVTHGKGRIPAKVQPPRPRGEVSTRELYKEVADNLTRCKGCREPVDDDDEGQRQNVVPSTGGEQPSQRQEPDETTGTGHRHKTYTSPVRAQHRHGRCEPLLTPPPPPLASQTRSEVPPLGASTPMIAPGVLQSIGTFTCLHKIVTKL